MHFGIIFGQHGSKSICANIFLDNVFGFDCVMDFTHELWSIDGATFSVIAEFEHRSNVSVPPFSELLSFVFVLFYIKQLINYSKKKI